MITGNRSSTDLYRAATHSWAPPLVLKPKRCGCGKTVHAKQLKQHGFCNTCVTKNKADTRLTLESASEQSQNGVANV